jgi:hypothetical protein
VHPRLVDWKCEVIAMAAQPFQSVGILGKGRKGKVGIGR